MRTSKNNGLSDLKRLRQDAADANSPSSVEQPVVVPPAPGKARRNRLALPPGDETVANKPAPSKAKQKAKAKPQGAAKTVATSVDLAASPPIDPWPETAALDASDVALFRRTMKSVKPIKDTRRAILPPMPAASTAMLRERRGRAVGRATATPPPISDHYAPASLSPDATHFVQTGCGPDLTRDLKRGKWPVQATLDLHGATLDQARTRLDQFLQSCLDHQIRCVQIVHGKGYGSKDGASVLKLTVRRWLTQLAAILAYIECSEQNGGSGAVQVLLRANVSAQSKRT